ncbi:Crp/Fnr family transcriptional regulator [Curvivirga sp.]|uniref:Crp/Fnr family transcriptional regulator n=1 Tax=Curvivirga sp. TaxID=2856848 RepID=UPI003B5B2E23
MWVDKFYGLSRLNSDLKDRLEKEAIIKTIHQGQIIFGPGTPPDQLLFLIDGTIRVQQVSPSGREIVLYRVNAGESCVLTTACLLAYEDYLAEGFAETDIKVAALPRAVFEDLLSHSKDFRHFVFTAYSRRITELFHLIQEVTFTKIDIRLAQKLLELAKDNKIRNITHQDLAVELGSVREVISRQLQEFQRRGWIKLARGAIDILDISSLTKQSQHN